MCPMNVIPEISKQDAVAEQSATKDELSLFANAPDSLSFKKLRKRLIRNTRQALDEFSMLPTAEETANGKRPRWLVGL